MTFEKGRRIPLAKKHNWRSQPRVMLKWRAVTAACRAVFSDIIGGLYTQEEVDEDNTLVREDGSMSWQPPESNPKSLPGSTSNNANQSDTPDWWTPDNRGKLAGFICKRDWSEAEKTNDILQDATDILGLDSYHALSEYEAGNAVVEALKEATKALESDQSDASDDDNKVINHPAKNATARTEAASKSSQSAADDAPNDDEPPVTWTSDYTQKYNDWLEANFDIDIEEAIHRDAIEDLTLFENFADARKKTVAHAVQNQWPVVVTDGTYTEANSNYINFSSAIGNIRWYGRSKLAEAAPEWNLAVNVTEWQPGESHRFSQEPLLLSWDDKGHYRVATAVVQIGDKVPF